MAALSCGPTITSTAPLAARHKHVAPRTPARVPPPGIRIFFRDGKAFAREDGQEWLISEVGPKEMLWAPDGTHFAYLKQNDQKPAPEADASSNEPRPKKSMSREKGTARRQGKTKKQKNDTLPPLIYHLVIRNIRGDSVNEFPVYRPGRPSNLDWIDNTQLGYLAPPDPVGDVYVIHSVQSGEILQIYNGQGFAWSPGHKQLAYIQRHKTSDQVRISQKSIWPRPPKEGEPPAKKKSHKIVGDVVWSPEGEGLAFMEISGGETYLVVLLVVDNPEGDLIWPLPKSAALNPNHQVFWAESKVVIGKSVLHPSFAASWTRYR